MNGRILGYSQHLYNFISFDKQTFSHVLNLLIGDKVSSPFTDSEFQKVKINGINEIFSKIFCCSSFYGVSENTEKYSKKSPQIRS